MSSVVVAPFKSQGEGLGERLGRVLPLVSVRKCVVD